MEHELEPSVLRPFPNIPPQGAKYRCQETWRFWFLSGRCKREAVGFCTGGCFKVLCETHYILHVLANTGNGGEGCDL